MGLTVQFDLADEDLEHCRELMQSVCARTDCRARHRIAATADQLVARLRATRAPQYVLRRLDTIETLIAMSRDEEWQLPEDEAERVSYALAYFSESGDLIPDDTPGIGYLDDAIMIELVAQELRHEIDAYRDFCRFRDAETARRAAAARDEPVTRRDWLDAKRSELQQRMRRESRGLGSLFSLFTPG